MHNNLDMSNTDINNVNTLRAATAILNNLTLGGRTGSQSSPYNFWAANATNASYAVNAGNAEYAEVAGALTGSLMDEIIGQIPVPETSSPIDGYEGNFSNPDSGWTKLPNGIIFQWGHTNSGGGGVISFPRSFPNACLQVILTNHASSKQEGEKNRKRGSTNKLQSLADYKISSFNRSSFMITPGGDSAFFSLGESAQTTLVEDFLVDLVTMSVHSFGASVHFFAIGY
jgi:hypothetical protein